LKEDLFCGCRCIQIEK